MRSLRTVLTCFVTVACAAPSAHAGLEIHGTFIPSFAPSNMVGGGTLQDIFEAAATLWERAFTDPADRWVVNLTYQWGPLTNGGQFFLDSQQTSAPYRILTGHIVLNNTGSPRMFADPDPLGDPSRYYDQYSELFLPSPYGDVTIGRYWWKPKGDAAGSIDLLSLVAHEMGHALGLSQYNPHVPTPLVLKEPLPFAGYELVTQGADHLQYNLALMNPQVEQDYRYMISPADILAEAQISSFDSPNLDPYAVPEPATLATAALGLAVSLAGRRRVRRIRTAA